MITEDYVSFETAKLLKEKGFEGDTSCYFVPDSSRRWIYQHYHDFDKKDRIECPTLQMAMKWLREIHNIHIVVYPYTDKEGQCWNFNFNKYAYDCWHELAIYITDYWNSYEKTCEEAIKYCLENLI